MTRRLFDILEKKESTLEICDYFIDQLIRGETRSDYFEQGMRSWVRRDIEVIHKYCNSPIEKVFLGSLVLNFIKADPMNILFTTPFADTPKQVEGVINSLNESIALWEEFKLRTKTSSRDQFDKFLDYLVQSDKITMDARTEVSSNVTLHLFLDIKNRYHLTVQAAFPDYRINNRYIRVDMLIWKPSKPKSILIVECDGFTWHCDKSSFVTDRQRDRLLKKHAYDVMRFSGLEIYSDPIKASSDLFDHLIQLEEHDV